MATRIAFIIGAGSNVGQAVALKLKEGGYKVAVGSRNPDVGGAEKNGFLPVTVDVSDVTTIENGFKAIRESYGGPPNVVIFNPARHVQPPVSGEPLSLDISDIQNASNLGVGLFSTAQHALSGFRDLAKSGSAKVPTVFIFTGNALPFLSVTSPPWNNFTALGLEKRTGAFFLESFAAAYEKEGFRFYFADQNKADGTAGGSEFSGEAHATAYWELVERKGGSGWYHRFGRDGHELPGRDKL